MRIICKKCNRAMNAGEVLPHVGVYLGQKLAPAIVPLLGKALECSWTLLTRSVFDDSMASVANICEIKCPSCKKYTCWNPYPESNDLNIEQAKKENVATKQ